MQEEPRAREGYNRLLWEICSARPFSYLAVIILNVSGMLFAIISPLIMRSLIDDVLIGKNTALLMPLLAAMAGVFLVSALSNYLSARVRGTLSIGLYREFSLRVFARLQRADYAHVRKFKTGDLLSRITGNVTTVVQTAIRTIPQILVIIFGIVLPLLIMISMDAALTAIVILPALLFVVSAAWFGKRMKAAQRPALDAEAGIQSFLKETLPSLPLIRVFGIEKWADKRYDTEFGRFSDTSVSVIRLSSLSAAITMLIYSVPTLLVLALGSMSVLAGTITVGTLTAFVAYVGLFLSPVLQVSDLWNSYKSSQASYDRVAEVMELKPDAEGSVPLPPGGPVEIRFEHVSFSYDRRVVLSDVSGRFSSGINYLTGENGSGKSTLLRLICRLYSPDSGRITINGTDLASIKRDDLRSNVSMVFSDSLIFDGTIADNILIGDLSATGDEVVSAAKRAGLDGFVRTLQKKYDTPVGENGLNLSSGEMQKIALARVLLRDSPVILFDEFTRSIDEESKRSIYEVIQKLTDKTVIIVTHTPADIREGSNVVHL
ncbi:ABC transporter ATP-binding protein [Methanoregula sp. UBA64]|uniref:ABC transporter ATP-binding protein n=1 Tax=Methanoregula sp. UBA64 TaxID=1915554 RepID=UPI0025CFF2B6|nr:ABC transporter ATP-binding protein [Methanoregula sp. UBA64]